LSDRTALLRIASAFLVVGGLTFLIGTEVRRSNRQGQLESARRSYSLIATMTAEGLSSGYFQWTEFRDLVQEGRDAKVEKCLGEIPAKFHFATSARIEGRSPPSQNFEVRGSGGSLFAYFPIADSDGLNPLPGLRAVVSLDSLGILEAIQPRGGTRLLLGSGEDFAFGLQARFVGTGPRLWDLAFALLAGMVAAAIVGAFARRHESLFYEAKGLEAIIYLFEQNERYSASHSRNVASLALFLGSRLGLRGKRLRDLYTAALLHDIGKITVPVEILVKPGKLEPQERARVMEHPAASARILASFPELAHLAEIVARHHEREEGEGYPSGRFVEPLPLESRIIAVADVFEALTGERPYRYRLPVDEAIATMRGEALDQSLIDLLDRSLSAYPGFALPKWAHSCRHPGNVFETWSFANPFRPAALEPQMKGM